jgi:hypothetical protein
MSDFDSAESEDIRRHLSAVDIDLSSSLAFSRALMYSLATTSDRLRRALEAALAEELTQLDGEESDTAVAVRAIIDEARITLGCETPAHRYLVRDVEQAIIAQAHAITDKI